VPFEGESVGEVLMKHLTAEPDLSALAEPYRDIVQRALAKDPEVRLHSVNEMVSLLPGGEGIPPVPRSPEQRRPPATAFGGGTVEDADAAARDGLKLAAQLIRSGDERVRNAARSSDPDAEEPIWKAIRNGAHYVRRRWHGEGVDPMPLLHKVLFAIAIGVGTLWLFKSGLDAAFQVLLVYFIYYIFWASYIRPSARRDAGESAAAKPASTAPSPQETVAWAPGGGAAAANVAAREAVQARRRLRPSWRDRAQRELAARPIREKISELLGSMLLAALVAVLAAAVVPLVFANQPGSERLATYLWLATIGTLGSWAILVPSKFAEGKLEDYMPMRIALLLLGAVVGMAGWFIADALLLKSPGWGEPVDVGHGLLSHEMLGWPATAEGVNPTPAVFLAYFAFLFLLPRWWRQTECTRATRLSLWWVFVSMGWAWLLHIFWWFPQPTGILAAGIIAAATRLASPWIPPSRRRALAAEIEGGLV
jgi:hypothetical protein